MGQVCLISGPPGCGKTTWVLQRLQQHQGPCAYLRLDVNRLFTARCRRQFRLELSGGSIQSHVKDHAGEQQSEQAVPKRSVIGIGGGRHYTLYDPATDHIEFRLAGEPSNASGRGFG